MRKFGLCVAAVVVVGFSVAIADEINGTITKVDGDKITVQPKKGKKDTEAPKAVTLSVTKDTVIKKGKVNFDKDTKKVTIEEGDAIEGGLKNELFTSKFPEKGVAARITTDGDKATKIVVTQGKKKGKGTN
jgi:hypothetical protein